jgi:23S rRNA pseudouridine1911/1915/1917 synthase
VRQDGIPALTRWRFIANRRYGNLPYTCIQCSLDTGRRNQIRAHTAYIGHPIAGDFKYGAQSDPLGRLALHAETLSFMQPHTKKMLSFSSKAPF